ncbi:TetR/AcrR family transcriptional regulator [Liquorilactobacillus mali]|uniref:Transcriptional regulator n=1 Tax=Liquorilactobacillus mali KCTC 3596 = DSM 20444 TaxID=1046596 RepID=J0UQ86_9LACO|nr:TetR/AcrR family transcriptional regulator [Liquorilactobacillus mali]EJE97996.1 transcriptional regulator [Liquorilactobacillus mali KCTC 3596 = DSM 20444]KRN08663.1 transcriptional regulator [Liquorilactobacillus mali KCTC 3596 = DSM 20444]MDC7952425.1 TetR/AcrR family transcriptional regulator [Liquorilactobacillus mali]QFQ75743.1 TetR/AcrR family transcriptional regulator [Liquorilactobacillus mali]
MTKLTNDLILKTAAELVEQKGATDVTLSDVGIALGTSHAAIYKHFKNKRDLWTSLSLYWLDQVLIDILPFNTDHYASKKEIAHDWLWKFANGKMQAYWHNPQMFKLYTDYIENDPVVLERHLNDLYQSLAKALKIRDMARIRALIQAFACFTTPAFSSTWGPESRQQFEAIWQLIAPSFNETED